MREKDRVILLVEDNPDDELLTIRGLQRGQLANKIVVARDGEEALDYVFGTGKYEARAPGDMPMLILLDLKLPKLDGIEVLKRIRQDKRTKRIPVVVLTSSTEEQDLSACYDLGCNSYIRKPVDFKKFSEVVEQLKLYWFVINKVPPIEHD